MSAATQSAIEFAVITVAILASVLLALLLEWLTLWGLMHLMPVSQRTAAQQPALVTQMVLPVAKVPRTPLQFSQPER